MLPCKQPLFCLSYASSLLSSASAVENSTVSYFFHTQLCQRQLVAAVPSMRHPGGYSQVRQYQTLDGGSSREQVQRNTGDHKNKERIIEVGEGDAKVRNRDVGRMKILPSHTPPQLPIVRRRYYRRLPEPLCHCYGFDFFPFLYCVYYEF
ncbi:hypothetical protein PIB30_054154 [Stylosanthes scabra]|uniref:Secreted protein n=1 Tax=Stylosanthes scabra TaxID=79078 RepID=A0ABU6RIV4_9FABA|nr:hypothetical protein [Stylosanthes scabra]